MALFEFLGLLFAGVSIITYFIGRHKAREELQGLESRLNYKQLKNLEILDRAGKEAINSGLEPKELLD